MNNTIWKYSLKATDYNEILLPTGAEILCVQMQNGEPCMWAMVNSEETKKELHIIETFGTGHSIDHNPRKYIGTYQLQNGYLVFHVFQYLGV